MGKQQFFKQLISGLQTGYQQSSTAFLDKQAEEREFARDQEVAKAAAKLERQQRLAEEEAYKKEGTIINTLLRGKRNGRDLTFEEQVDYKTQLSAEGIDRLEQLTKLKKKGSKYLQSGKYIYEVVDGVLNPTPVNDIPEAPPVKKRINSKYGINAETGEPGWAVGYDDGTSSFTPSPLAKGSTVDSNGEVETILDYDAIKFDKTMNPFSKTKNHVAELKDEYRKTLAYTDIKDLTSERDEINEIVYDNEQTLYEIMPKATKKHVNEFYDYLRSIAAENNLTLKALVSYNQEGLLEDFKEKMLALKKNGEITSRELRLLSLWGKFKFGYLIESEEDARQKESLQQ